MNKKKLAKSVVGIALIVSVAILIVVCVGKIKHIQNKKNIIGTWKNANAEEVFTFQENGGLVNKDARIVLPVAMHYIAYLPQI